MAKQLNIGVAGLTHGHVGGLIASWKQVEGAKLVAVADETPLMDIHGPNFERRYTSWKEMLDKEQLDALVVTSNNVESSEIAVQALGKGIPCLVEKAMAANYADAARMLGAQKASGKLLMINWPIMWSTLYRDVKKHIDSGAIGNAFHFRFRTGHHGPKEIGCDEWFVKWLYDEKLAGGGAIADFCCYGAALSVWYFGMPETVYAVRGNYTKEYEISDDHAVVLLKYPKMDVVLEGTWATMGFDESANPVVHGTLGGYGDKVKLFAPGKVEELASTPIGFAGPAPYFVHCMETGEKPIGMLDPDIAAGACKILDAAIKSTKSGCAEKP